jgi:hypothetical protein
VEFQADSEAMGREVSKGARIATVDTVGEMATEGTGNGRAGGLEHADDASVSDAHVLERDIAL